MKVSVNHESETRSTRELYLMRPGEVEQKQEEPVMFGVVPKDEI